MNMFAKAALPVAALFAVTLSGAAQASDISDVARQFNLPVPVVEAVVRNVDAYFTSADAPGNRMASGIVKEIALKAVKSRMGGLDESGPGKASEASAEEKNAIYKAQVRTTRHETTETAECVDNTATVTASEGVPVVKDGAFAFDNLHPKVSSASWKLTFCRTPLNGGTDFTEWQMK